MKRFYTILLNATIALTASSQTEQSNATTSITETINSSGIITVSHPDALERRISPFQAVVGDDASADSIDINTSSDAVRKIGGYRVQIFSDNNNRTAKNEAQAKAVAINEAFPQYPTYVVYTSPYCRVKVGDFRSREEAELIANEIKRAFPAYAREIRVVRDRINSRQ